MSDTRKTRAHKERQRRRARALEVVRESERQAAALKVAWWRFVQLRFPGSYGSIDGGGGHG